MATRCARSPAPSDWCPRAPAWCSGRPGGDAGVAGRSRGMRFPAPSWLPSNQFGAGTSLRPSDRFDLDLEADLLGDHQSAVVEDHVPREAPVLAVEGAPRAEDRPMAAPGILDVAEVFDLESDGPGHALDREVARDRAGIAGPGDAGRAERGPRVVLDVEEVRGTEVVVTRLVARAHRTRVDLDLESRLGEVVGERDRAGDTGEPAANLGEHEVASDERDLGVARVDRPNPGGGQVDAVERTGGCHVGFLS